MSIGEKVPKDSSFKSGVTGFCFALVLVTSINTFISYRKSIPLPDPTTIDMVEIDGHKYTRVKYEGEYYYDLAGRDYYKFVDSEFNKVSNAGAWSLNKTLSNEVEKHFKKIKADKAEKLIK